MPGLTAFYDASVLYPSELRSLLMHLALTGLFRARWSAAVHEEWIRALLRRRPDLSRAKLERTRMLMDLYASHALVTGYEELIDGLQLPDANDRHVLAAAIQDEMSRLAAVGDSRQRVAGVPGSGLGPRSLHGFFWPRARARASMPWLRRSLVIDPSRNPRP